MTANTFIVTSSHDGSRVPLRGDMDVLLPSVATGSFSIRFVCRSKAFFSLRSAASILDLTGNLVTTTQIGGQIGLSYELMFNTLTSVWEFTDAGVATTPQRTLVNRLPWESSTPVTTPPVTTTPVQTAPPTITLATSAASVTASSSLTLTATVVAAAGVAKVDFYRGTTLITSVTAAPYKATLLLTSTDNATLSFTAVVTDTAGVAVTSSAKVVAVNIPVPDTTAPTVSVSASKANVTTAQSITLTPVAADNVAVVKVELYKNGVLFGQSTTAPYTFTVPLVIADNGTINFTAKAYDGANNSTISSPAAVVVNIPVPDTTSPVVSLGVAAATVTAEGTFNLTATATDNVGVVKVDFYNGVTLVSSISQAPWVAPLYLTYADNATIVYTAKAYDAANNVATSNSVSVKVTIPPPGVPVITSDFDETTKTAYKSAATAAVAGSKRQAAANALIAAMKTAQQLYIYQDTTLVIPALYTGSMVSVSSATSLYVTFGTPISNNPLVNADLSVGTWRFELRGGDNYSAVYIGTVGAVGSGAELILSMNPAIGTAFDQDVRFVFPNSLDAS